MKQQINPVVIAVSVVVLIGLVVFIAVRSFSSTPQTGAAPVPAENAIINGQKVPAGAPSAAFDKAKEESGGK